MADWGETKKEEKKEDSNIIFEDINKVVDNRGINILIYGSAGSGKTHFAMTAPAPIYILDSERGSILLKENFPNKDIKILTAYKTDEVSTYEMFDNAINKIIELAKEGKVKTVVMDSSTDFWESVQNYAKIKLWKLSITDRLKMQFDWGKINQLYYKNIKKLILSDVNVIITARSKEVYAGANPTGNYEAKTQKDTAYWADICIENNINVRKGEVFFVSEIKKTRMKGKQLIGKTFENLNFDKLKEEISK